MLKSANAYFSSYKETEKIMFFKLNAYLYSITLYGRKWGRRYLIMRIGSQSMSSTIDPKTICNKEIKQVSLANSQTST